ncbi:hypothetical protein ACS0TY_031483 [Phlomoides rotata]
MRTEEKFSEFYEKWMGQLEDHLALLLQVSKENNSDKNVATVNKLTAHHKEFYKVKWDHEDVLGFFSPVWLTPLEIAYMWVTGWKPSMVFRLVETVKSGMTEEQARRIEALRVNMKAEEEKVEREMERQQMRVADRSIVELARLESAATRSGDATVVSRVNGLVEVALRGVVAGLKKVMKMADCVRLKTLKGVLDVLNPVQCVDFLAATCMLQIQMRRWGKNTDKSSLSK